MSKVYFSVGEQEIIEALQRDFGITYIEACEHVIGQKRELAYIHERRGNFALAEQLLKEVGEWNDELHRRFKEKGAYDKAKSSEIFIPGK